MKKVSIFFMLLIALNISAQDIQKIKPVGKASKTLNPKIPYIYIKGYFDYSIVQSSSIIINRPVNVLKFNRVFSALYTKKFMFDKFGMWDKEIRLTEKNNLILFWEKRKLFDDDNSLYNVFVYGEEGHDEIYAAVLVLNEKNEDCLHEESPYKEKVIKYFSEGIQQLSDDKTFYNIYWGKINK